MASSRIPSLDGVRAISITLVIAGHFAETHRSGPVANVAGAFANLGVRIFFVLSGYLITRLLIEEQNRSPILGVDLRAFYIRRAFRILPASLFFMFTVFVLFRRQLSLQHALAALFYVTNFDPGHPWFLGHLWSLSVEEQFYLVWPLAIKKWRVHGKLILVSVIVFAPIYRIGSLLAGFHGRADETFPAVADILATGCLLALCEAEYRLPRIRKIWAVAMSALLIAVPAYYGMLRFHVTSLLLFAGWPLLHTSIAGLLLFVMQSPGRILNARPVAWLGVLSYSLYLWQQLFAFGPTPRPMYFLTFALMMACVSFYALERPMMSIGTRVCRARFSGRASQNSRDTVESRRYAAVLALKWLRHVVHCGIAVLFLVSVCFAQSLRQEANSAKILIGTAVRLSQLSETAYASTLGREFSMVEPEDALKWRTLRPSSSAYDFRQGDAIVRFAQAHQMKVRGHCLVWDHDNPEWLAQGQFTKRQLARLLQEHIRHVMSHYKGEVFAWDVINEALDENGEVRASVWYNQPGIGQSGNQTKYIEQVFRWAHQADSHALLFYNEAEGEEVNRKSDAIYSMLKHFRAHSVPIDGIGLQMHVPTIDVDIPAMIAKLSANMARLTALGLQVHITELDVPLPIDANGQASDADLIRQADVYRGIVRACLNLPGCTAIQTWGFTDKYSWIGSHSKHTRGQALLFDRNYYPKAAYDAVSDELSAGRPLSH